MMIVAKISATFGFALLFFVTAICVCIVGAATTQQAQSLFQEPFPELEQQYTPDSHAIGTVNESKLSEVKSQKLSQAPEDRQKHHLAIVVPSFPDSKAKVLEQWASTGQLSEIASKCHYHIYTTKDEIYRARLSQALPEIHAPGVMLISANGQCLYLAAGGKLPATDAQLCKELTAAAQSFQESNRCPDGRCPSPNVTPTIDPPKVPDRFPWATPDNPTPRRPFRDQARDDVRSIVWLAGGLVAVVVALIFFAVVGGLCYTFYKIRG